MSELIARVLSVGQCGYDHSMISGLLTEHFHAEVDTAAGVDEALGRMREHSYALVLVNRILDRDGGEGLELVRRVLADDILRSTPIMLVSNFPDAQREAVEAGAVPGFGKGALDEPATTGLLTTRLPLRTDAP